MANGTTTTAVPDVESPKVSHTAVASLGIFLIFLFFLTVYFMYALWPEVSRVPCVNTTSDPVYCWVEKVNVFGCVYTISSEQRMILLVLVSGALGSLIHAATSFSNYVGDGKLDQKWMWWYILRPLIGMAVAMVFYLVFRGGLITASDIEVLNIYGVLTMAALSGLFTDRATLKLKEVFDTLFKPRDNRSDKLEEKKARDFEDPKAKS